MIFLNKYTTIYVFKGSVIWQEGDKTKIRNYLKKQRILSTLMIKVFELEQDRL